MNPRLDCEISHSLLHALEARSAETGEPISHIVMEALADALQVQHSTLFQISTAPALVEGVTQGAITIDSLAEHGDLGLGTFADFDGEMAAVDGEFYQVTRDGVNKAEPTAPVPFAVMTHFVPEQTFHVQGIESFDDLMEQIDSRRQTDNEFFAVRIDGHFEYMKTRAVCKAEESTSLVDVADRQAIFEFENVAGTLIGFWTPEYAKTLNIKGWHLHFLSDDRTMGGHLLTCKSHGLKVQFQSLSDFRLAIPENQAFLHADLTQNRDKELEKAEKDH